MTDRRSPETPLEAATQVINDLVAADLSAAARQAPGEEEPGAAAGIDAEDLAALVATARESDRLKLELAAVNKKLVALKERLLEQFLEAGVKQYKTNDATVFIKKNEFYGLRKFQGEETADAEARIAAELEEIGLGHIAKHITKVDLPGAKSTLKELNEDPEANADAIAALGQFITVAEVYELGVRRN